MTFVGTFGVVIFCQLGLFHRLLPWASLFAGLGGVALQGGSSPVDRSSLIPQYIQEGTSIRPPEFGFASCSTF